MKEDGRKRLRAHWPPRLRQTVQVELPDWLYADLYVCARAEGWSLADEIRSRLRGEMAPAGGRAADRRPRDFSRALSGAQAEGRQREDRS